MKIGISINEVLRDFVGQMTYTYNKYYSTPDLTIKVEDVNTFNFTDIFPFKNVDEFNRFLYSEAALEIFGHADVVSDGLMNQFNYLLFALEDEGEHQIELVSREIDKSIPSTFFFLSKTGCRIPQIRFVKKNVDEWDGVDTLITANPIALEAKPSGKVSVKVKTAYNADIPSDYEIDSILDIIKDESLRTKIFNTTIISYE